jgi:hypothetical protein|tara:strand:+ start:15722 stop:16489 length:768 start_codon:yes stop_codon:yes gene_type:complete
MVTLGAFIVGSTFGALHEHWWKALPELPAVSLLNSLGLGGGLVASFAMFGAVTAVTLVAEQRRHGRVWRPAKLPRQGLNRVLRGPWPLVVGAVGLALANFATLALAGRPWGVTSGFALWGSKTAGAIGFAPESWPYWESASRAAALEGSVFTDITSVMNVGIILGAMVAAGLAGRFRPVWQIPRRSLVAAVLGGLLLGYGARQAYGCNIGAYFSGIASGSLHGWLWLLAAFCGGILGTRLRPWFGLTVERTGGSC